MLDWAPSPRATPRTRKTDARLRRNEPLEIALDLVQIPFDNLSHLLKLFERRHVAFAVGNHLMELLLTGPPT